MFSAASALHKKSLSLRSGRKQSPRSGRQHKAWGASPRIRSQKQARARETGDSVKFTGFRPLSRAPTSFYSYVNLGLAPQALCLRLLSQAKKHHSISRFKFRGWSFLRRKSAFPFNQEILPAGGFYVPSP